MPGSPGTERADDRYQNVQNERSWGNHRRGDTEQGHHRDVTGCAGMANRRIEKRDDTDGCEKKKKMRCIHQPAMIVVRKKRKSKDQLFWPLIGLFLRHSSISFRSSRGTFPFLPRCARYERCV